MSDRFIREKNLIGEDKFNVLQKKSVAVFGLGGVGSYCAEALVRAGVGKILICDGDVVVESNINRQLFALSNTIGKKKTAVAFERFKEISPSVEIIEKPVFYDKETAGEFDLSGFDYVADCIDTVTSKLILAKRCKEENVRIITCLGTGNKLDNTAFKITDIYKTKVCPLARVMRSKLKAIGVTSLDVLYSEEAPIKPFSEDKRTPASISFVPGVAGLMIAGKIINDLLGE